MMVNGPPSKRNINTHELGLRKNRSISMAKNTEKQEHYFVVDEFPTFSPKVDSLSFSTFTKKQQHREHEVRLV